jgi:hypothetical protein
MKGLLVSNSTVRAAHPRKPRAFEVNEKAESPPCTGGPVTAGRTVKMPVHYSGNSVKHLSRASEKAKFSAGGDFTNNSVCASDQPSEPVNENLAATCEQ